MGEIVMPDIHPHCEAHSGNIVTIKVHSEQLEDLYNKHSEIKDLHAKISQDLAVLATTMEKGFKASECSLAKVHAAIEKMWTTRTETLKKYDAIFERYDEKFKELDKFTWFRNGMNSLNAKLPFWCMYALMGILALVVIINWTAIGRMITKMLEGK